MADGSGRVVLFLQGPHGPFFRRLAGALKVHGAAVRCISFNSGDEADWRRAGPLHRVNGDRTGFTAWLDSVLDGNGISDIVLYGDARPLHRIAIEIARRRGLIAHCFEEGYLGPGWITYERGGTGGNSRLMDIGLSRMAEAMGEGGPAGGEAPAIRGDEAWRLSHSARYRIRCLLPARRYDRRHGPLLWAEVARYGARFLEAPWGLLRRTVLRWLLLRSDKTFHLVLLQRSSDPSVQAHSDFRRTSEFIERVIDAFAEGAAPGDHLVFMAPPFEGGRARLGRTIRLMAHDLGVGRRVTLIGGGIGGGRTLSALLDQARSVITVNSTAAPQALWRGLPVAVLGRAIYCKPSLASEQPLAAFLRQPQRPDLRAYWLFRRFLVETSQVAGSFYAREGIDRLAEQLPTLMLDSVDAYDRVLARRARSEDSPAGTPPKLIPAG